MSTPAINCKPVKKDDVRSIGINATPTNPFYAKIISIWNAMRASGAPWLSEVVPAFGRGVRLIPT